PAAVGARARGRDAPRGRPRHRPRARAGAPRRPAALGSRRLAGRARARLAPGGPAGGRPARNLAVLHRRHVVLPTTARLLPSFSTDGHVQGTVPRTRPGRTRRVRREDRKPVQHYAPTHDLTHRWRTR